MKINITIDAKWGSDFQKDVLLSALKGMIKQWVLFMKTTHKGNKAKVKIDIK